MHVYMWPIIINACMALTWSKHGKNERERNRVSKIDVEDTQSSSRVQRQSARDEGENWVKRT